MNAFQHIPDIDPGFIGHVVSIHFIEPDRYLRIPAVKVFALAHELAEMLREDLAAEVEIYPRAFFSNDFSLVERQTEAVKRKVIALRGADHPGEEFLSSIGFSRPGKE